MGRRRSGRQRGGGRHTPAPLCEAKTVKRNVTRAVRLVILRDLQRFGFLEGLTLEDIGTRLEVNRSTILRDLRDLPELEEELRRQRALWRGDVPHLDGLG